MCSLVTLYVYKHPRDGHDSKVQVFEILLHYFEMLFFTFSEEIHQSMATVSKIKFGDSDLYLFVGNVIKKKFNAGKINTGVLKK